jgi:1-acyl-sn-glycerol-3-phosphate acyltransferase
MALLRSLLFTLVYYLGCIPTVLGAMLMIPFGQAAIVRGSRRWALWHRWCARHILGIETRIDGVLPQHSVLVVMKHESMYEAVETLALFDRPAVVVKRELTQIPVWGYVAGRHGVIPVDRDSGASAVRLMLAAGRAAIAQDRPIVLFPEGSRIPHGEQPALKAGMAGLYRLLGLPIVPVALNSGLLAPNGQFIKKSGVVTFKVGETIPPGLKREEVEARVHAAINALNGEFNDLPARNRGVHHPGPAQ